LGGREHVLGDRPFCRLRVRGIVPSASSQLQLEHQGDGNAEQPRASVTHDLDSRLVRKTARRERSRHDLDARYGQGLDVKEPGDRVAVLLSTVAAFSHSRILRDASECPTAPRQAAGRSDDDPGRFCRLSGQPVPLVAGWSDRGHASNRCARSSFFSLEQRFETGTLRSTARGDRAGYIGPITAPAAARRAVMPIVGKGLCRTRAERSVQRDAKRRGGER
jgi:hypothetical protein